VLVEQGPGIAEGACFAQQRSEAPDKIMAIHVIFEDVGLCDTANDDVLKQTGDIDTGLTWHGEKNISVCQFVQDVPLELPQKEPSFPI
jgi:hypothetical protein